MRNSEANDIRYAFYNKSAPDEEDIFLYTEAMTFLIDQTKDPRLMLELGGFYYGEREFDLALKYYELAAEYKLPDAYDCLGYIWYYGRTGRCDYEKAFRYFSLSKEAGNLQAAYKVADMYKNGYYVEKDPEKYKAIIEELYPQVASARNLGSPLPEIFTRLARIRTEEGRTDEAVDLYLSARDFLAQRLKYNDFFGDRNIMMWLIDDLYKLIPFDRDHFDLYGLFYLLNFPCVITFCKGKRKYSVSVTEEDGEAAIFFNGKWFRKREDFFENAQINGEKLTALWDELYGFEVK